MVAKELEQKMLRNIEAAGFKRFVKHERFDKPKMLLGSRKITAITTVTLVKEGELGSGETCESKATAKCSESDSWNKRLGRVIATGRAMRAIGIKEEIKWGRIPRALSLATLK